MAATALSWLGSWAISAHIKDRVQSYTRRTWKKALRGTLEEYCEDYEWDADNEMSDTVVIVKDAKLRPHVIDQLLRSLGVRADAATVGSVRLCLSVGLDLDVGLFSKPWRVEVQDLKLELELGAAPAGDEAEDTAEAAGSAPSPDSSPQRSSSSSSKRSSSSEDWLPLHRAAENLQLSLRNTVVVLRGLEPGRCLVIRLEQATLSTTDSEWAPIQKVAADAVDDGSVLHKEVSFFGLDVQLQRAQEAEVDSWERSWLGEGGDEADGRASGVKEGGEGRVAVEIPTAVAGRLAVGMAIGDRARAPLLSPPPPVQQLVAVSGLRGRMRIKKRLKRDLTGSVASDWWGDEYLFLLSAASDGVPRLQLTGVLLRLKWSEEIEEYVLNHEKTAQLSVGHSLDATLLAELNTWSRQILQAYAEVAPSAETRLAIEQRRRAEEHEKLVHVTRSLRAARQILEDWQATASAKLDEAARIAAEVAIKQHSQSQRVRARQMLEALEARAAQQAPPAEVAAAALEALRELAGQPVPPPRAPFEGGYKLGDASRATAAVAAGGVESVVRTATGNSGYKFGDGTRAAMKWMGGGSS